MAEHKTEIDLSIGGNAEKKLNDFIDKANQLGEQLNKISGIEILSKLFLPSTKYQLTSDVLISDKKSLTTH